MYVSDVITLSCCDANRLSDTENPYTKRTYGIYGRYQHPKDRRRATIENVRNVRTHSEKRFMQTQFRKEPSRISHFWLQFRLFLLCFQLNLACCPFKTQFIHIKHKLEMKKESKNISRESSFFALTVFNY